VNPDQSRLCLAARADAGIHDAVVHLKGYGLFGCSRSLPQTVTGKGGPVTT